MKGDLIIFHTKWQKIFSNLFLDFRKKTKNIIIFLKKYFWKIFSKKKWRLIFKKNYKNFQIDLYLHEIVLAILFKKIIKNKFS